MNDDSATQPEEHGSDPQGRLQALVRRPFVRTMDGVKVEAEFSAWVEPDKPSYTVRVGPVTGVVWAVTARAAGLQAFWLLCGMNPHATKRGHPASYTGT